MTNWHYHARQIIKRADASARYRFKEWDEQGVTQEWRDFDSFYKEELEKLIADELELMDDRHAMEMREFQEANNGNG